MFEFKKNSGLSNQSSRLLDLQNDVRRNKGFSNTKLNRPVQPLKPDLIKNTTKENRKNNYKEVPRALDSSNDKANRAFNIRILILYFIVLCFITPLGILIFGFRADGTITYKESLESLTNLKGKNVRPEFFKIQYTFNTNYGTLLTADSTMNFNHWHSTNVGDSVPIIYNVIHPKNNTVNIDLFDNWKRSVGWLQYIIYFILVYIATPIACFMILVWTDAIDRKKRLADIGIRTKATVIEATKIPTPEDMEYKEHKIYDFNMVYAFKDVSKIPRKNKISTVFVSSDMECIVNAGDEIDIIYLAKEPTIAIWMDESLYHKKRGS